MTLSKSPCVDEGFLNDLDWDELLLNQSYQAALPAALSNERLEQIWADFQPSSEYGLRIMRLILHMVCECSGLGVMQLVLDDQRLVALRDSYEILVKAERVARTTSTSAMLETERFLTILDEASAYCRRNMPTPQNSASPLQAAYENDEASKRGRELRARLEAALAVERKYGIER